MSHYAQRLARAEEKLRDIEARENMQVVIDRYGGHKPLVIDYAPKSKPKRQANRRRSSGRRSR